MTTITEQEFIRLTLSPIERENPRAVRYQKIAYRQYCDRVVLHGDPEIKS